MAETKRAPVRDPRTRDLDAASDHMAEILRRSDALLAEWSRFGTAVRAQVEREAMRVGDVVGAAVDDAAARATTAAVDRALTERIGTQLAAISAEVGKLETRARAASRAIAEQRRGDRALLVGVIVAVLIANALLVVLLLRKPTAVAPIAPEPVPVVVPTAEPTVPTTAAPKETEPAAEGSGSAKAEVSTQPPTTPSQTPTQTKDDPKSDPKLMKSAVPTKPVAEPIHKPIKQGPPTGARRP